MASAHRLRPRTAVLIAIALALGVTACGEPDQESGAVGTPVSATDWTPVARAIGKTGEVQPGNVYRVGFPRSDLRVRVGRVTIKPALALGGYAAFMATHGNKAMVMGDLVLTAGEYNRVIGRLQSSGVRVTAVHKHLPGERPALWWTHFEANGSAVKIARAVHAALRLTGTPFRGPSAPAPQPGLDTQRLDQLLGASGKPDGGVYKYSIPRARPVREHGRILPAGLGIATVLNFQPVGARRAAINGDFAMTAAEVNPVIAALRQAGIQLVSLHNHGLTESPRLFYAHFWAVDRADKLARGLRRALDKTAAKK